MRIPQPIGGKVVVITGAARGLGAALAEKLAGRGARVALLGLEPEQLAAVAERCGRNAVWFECDVTDPAQLAAAVAGVQERFRGVDVLVANAGIAMGSPLLLAEPEAYDRVIEVNLLGSIRTLRAFLPLLIRNQGYYLQIASLAALSPTPMITSYGASKAGVEAFALGMRTELAVHGVGGGVAYLSFTDTDMGRSASRSGRGLRLHDLEKAVSRLVEGIERRSPYVYGQSFIRVLRPVRGLLPGLVHRMARGPAARFESAVAQAGPRASAPIGPGGRADTKARGSRDPEPMG
ncbi:SDR family NAD(P)-dependent oxidoreductase [Kineosporia rhizophila]|uniref:SDR family NAD(P)-dependent oxidoreductase n=1 Tax=Kineosporia TaxID=49184 RepID=UPI001E469FC5|nr:MULTISPECIES: SDR family NAD(P)-dependent oxidoreductase [Kineosporia]MCE0535894.1 SDR family NAD(P)-dependent oxidoreductase [Kineosporia rhizophila]GLY14278.1 short-chain dehydrogenase [Kineosporia sp. NBRC 101677]